MADYPNIEHYNASAIRPVYFRTSPNSEEALMVGVVLQNKNNIELIKVDNPNALSSLCCLFDDFVQEQVIFSLNVLKEHIRSFHDLDSIREPLSNLRFGKISNIECDDPKSFSLQFLQTTSSLYKYKGDCIKSTESVSHKVVTRKLYNAVSNINVVEATKLFTGYKLKTDKTKPIKLPIYGDRIVGATVSMITTQLNVARYYAESFIPKLAYARKKLDRQPVIYVLIPSIKNNKNKSQIEDNLGELSLFANEYDILFRYDKDIDELGHTLLYDDNKIV